MAGGVGARGAPALDHVDQERKLTPVQGARYTWKNGVVRDVGTMKKLRNVATSLVQVR